MQAGNGNPVAHQILTVSTVAVPFATAFNVNTTLVAFNVEGGNVRFRCDGVAPTNAAGGGILLYNGIAYVWDKQMAASAQFIRDSGSSTDATLSVMELAC